MSLIVVIAQVTLGISIKKVIMSTINSTYKRDSVKTIVTSYIVRISNILIAGGLITVTLPLMAGIALAIKLDSPGPVFSRYRRADHDGRPISVLRFRITSEYLQQARPGFWDKPLTRGGRFSRYIR